MEEKFYKISAFARRIGVTANTLRAWEAAGYLLPHHYTPSGYRIYTESQVKEYLDKRKKTNVKSN